MERLLLTSTLSTLIARADLSDNEKRVLSAYCLNPSEPTMREVGDLLHITGERVRQISESIIKKLRKVNERGDRKFLTKGDIYAIFASEGKYSSGIVDYQRRYSKAEIFPVGID